MTVVPQKVVLRSLGPALSGSELAYAEAADADPSAYKFVTATSAELKLTVTELCAALLAKAQAKENPTP